MGNTKKIILEVLPASHGDCILISVPDNNRFRRILIDGGISDTYHSFLKARLIELSLNQEVIDLCVVTHIDRDHIEGIIELLFDNGVELSKTISIKEVWHNSFKHLQFEKVKSSDASEIAILKGIIAGAKYQNQLIDPNNQNQEISAKQGSTLAALLHTGAYEWNKSFNGNAVNYDYKSEHKYDAYTIHLLSPNTKKLQRLSKLWKKELDKKKYGFKISDDLLFDDAFEFSLMSGVDPSYISPDTPISKGAFNYEDMLEDVEFDTSDTNGSSIAFILEHASRKLLFLGDSHPDIIADSLEKLKIEQGYELIFDAVKVSHHGSQRNISKRILQLIDSPKYIISTNGTKHGHPDISTLVKIICKESMFHKELLFNYRTQSAEFILKTNLLEWHNCSFVFPGNELEGLYIEI
ncbi:ComEC/Rec2 family competence protein [Paenibacillus alba]|uniref:MBL fold metallo-hydrolase n=1 Tax=Paenibacillus alba TaxID=1197127 RepID=A0ABU6G7F1_9BACL|nr:hypothetical protein [Paenibacillus alba]MEC0228748.1 hypothetical protein [Paenibacillus alba]